MGGGGPVVDDFPYYYAYGMYPGSDRWVPVYGGSFPSRRRGGLRYLYDNLEDDPLNYYYVDVPIRSGASFARRRKLNELMEENSKPRGQDASDIFMHPDIVSSNDVELKGDVPPPKPSAGKKSSQPRVVSIPIHFAEGGNDDNEIATVESEAGMKRSRTGIPAERAAVLIQSRFRGGSVRRTQPLTHLRKIATVRSELARLNEKILDPDFIEYARENTAGKLKLAETIMRLLLELDAVQGAHPVVRDIRRSTSKQVIALQERVDGLISEKMEAMVEHPRTNNLEKDLSAMEEDLVSRQPAARDGPEPTANTMYQSADCEASADPSFTGTKFQVTAHGNNEEQADLRNLKKFDSISVEPVTTKFESADNEAVVIPLVQHREIPHGAASAEVEAIFMDDNSDKQKSADDITSPAAVMEVDEKMGALDVKSGISNLHANAHTVQLENRVESPPASEIKLRTCQTAPAAPAEYTNEEDEEWWVDDRRNENTTSKVEHDRQDDIAELYGSKDTPIKMLLEKASLPSTHLQSDIIPVDQTILTIPYVQESALPCKDHTQQKPVSQVDEYLGISPALDSISGKCLSTFGNDLDRLLGKGDDRALLFKLGEENQILKSLMMGVIKWNQIQATTMQDVNRRLNELESRHSRRSSYINRRKHSRNIRMQ